MNIPAVPLPVLQAMTRGLQPSLALALALTSLLMLYFGVMGGDALRRVKGVGPMT